MLTLLSNIGLINGETEISKFESAAADIEQCAVMELEIKHLKEVNYYI
jgi:hypothetical protein